MAAERPECDRGWMMGWNRCALALVASITAACGGAAITHAPHAEAICSDRAPHAPTDDALASPAEAAVTAERAYSAEGASAEVRASAGTQLARAYYQLGLHLSSLAVIDELAGASDAPSEALVDFLLALADEPHTREHARMLLARTTTTAPSATYALAIGRAHADAGRLPEAEAVLGSIAPGAPERSEARWLLAELAIRQRQPEQAAAIFGELESSEPCATQRDLATLSLARTYFEHATSGETHGRGTMLANAYVLFSRVDASGRYADDAALGRAWTAAWLELPERALADLALLGERARAAHPEIDLLEATLAIERCDAVRARAALARVAATHGALQGLAERLSSDREALAADVARWLHPHGSPEPALAPLMARLGDDAGLRDAIAAHAAIARERALLAGSPTAFAASDAGVRAQQDLEVAAAFLVDAIGELAHLRASELLDEADTAASQARALAQQLDALSCDPPG